MAVELKSELKIPDLWYDFYARLLPGSLFIAGLRTLYFGNYMIPTLRDGLVLLGASYLVGLASQPLSSRITGWIQTLGERIAGINDKCFVRRIQHNFHHDSRQALVLSKMHAEVAFFVQVGILSIILLIILRTSSKFNCHYITFIPAAAFLFALEVANRRANRAKDLKTILNEETTSKAAEQKETGKTTNTKQAG